MIRKPPIVLLVCLLLVCLATGAAADAPSPAATVAAPVRLAVVATVESAETRALADLLTVELARQPSIETVERAELDRVLREQALTAAGLADGVRGRVTVGRLLRARMLILVGTVPEAKGGGAYSIVCDVSTGARLSHWRWSRATTHPKALAEQALDVLSRFPDGAKTLIAIPDFISRDLMLRYAHLQADLAEVLRQSLGDMPGLALVELEEAKNIASEMELTGEMVTRVMRLQVEGEYRTDALADGGPSIDIRIAIFDGGRCITELASGVIPLEHAGRFVGIKARARLHQMLNLPPQEDMDADWQFRQLVTRADAFAKIGEFTRSAALREAALLLNPEDVPQRDRLVLDYNRSCGSTIVWRRSLLHVETLIRNRRVDAAHGIRLFYGTIRSIFGMRATNAHLLQEEERLKKDFIRAVIPALVAGGANVPELANRVIEVTLLRLDGNYLAASDLSLLAELLCEILPEETPVAYNLLVHLRGGTRMFGQELAPNPPVDAWLGFIARLEKSPRPLVQLYGRYGRLCDLRYRLRDTTDETLALAKALAADVRKEPVAVQDQSSLFAVAARDEVGWLESARAAAVRAPATTPSTAPKEQKRSGPLLQSDGSLLCDRVRLVPLSIRVLDDHGNADKPLEGFRWRALGGRTRWKQLVPAWEGIDAVFAAGALLLVDKELVARPILVDPGICLSHVVFDGRYLWAASGYAGGLFVYDQQGVLVTHVKEAHGLPSSSHSMPIASLDEGRIMAAGSLGGFGGRGWIAIVELRDGEPVVRVIHEAIEVVQAFLDFEEQKNTRRRFDPSWIAGHRDEDGRQWVFVDRRNLPIPLIVDAATGIVTVYSAPEFKAPEGFPRSEGPETAFLSRAGEWHVAGSDNGFRSYRLDRQTRCLVRQKPLEDAPGWHSGNATGGSLVEDAGWLYYAGSRRWARRNLATGLDETLVDDRRSLPEYGSGNAWNLAVSRAHGLVAWIGDKLFKVVPPDDSSRSEELR